MAFLLEDGTGVQGANALAPVAFVDAYLSERGRSTENGWNAASTGSKQSAIIAATDYIGARWESVLRGLREFTFDAVAATATITIDAQSGAGETLTIAGVAFDMDLGSDLSAAATSLAAAIDASDLSGVVLAEIGTAGVSGAVVTLTAFNAGDFGNYLTIVDNTGGDVTIVDFAGGLDGGLQGTAFPRSGLYDSRGTAITGVPFNVRAVVAEYAVRALSSTLQPDPSYDDTGRVVVEKEEQVGPIRERTRFTDGGVLEQLIRPYPAADRLMLPFIKSRGGVVR